MFWTIQTDIRTKKIKMKKNSHEQSTEHPYTYSLRLLGSCATYNEIRHNWFRANLLGIPPAQWTLSGKSNYPCQFVASQFSRQNFPLAIQGRRRKLQERTHVQERESKNIQWMSMHVQTVVSEEWWLIL